MSLLMFLKKPTSRFAQISLFVFLVFISWNKPLWMVSIPVIWLLGGWLSGRSRIAFTLISLSAAAIAAVCLLVAGIDLRQTVATYSAASGRLNPLEKLTVLWQDYNHEFLVLLGTSMTSCLLGCLLYGRAETKRGRGIALIVLLVGGGTAYASAVSGEFPLAYMAVVPLVCMAGHRLIVDDSLRVSSLDMTTHRGNLFFAVFVLSASLLLGAGRARVWGAGPFYEWNMSADAGLCDNGFFRGSVISNRQKHIDAIARALVMQFGTDRKYFFATRLEYLYALTGVRSPPGLPLWWHPGTSYRLQDSEIITTAFFNHRFDFVVHMYDGHGIPPEIFRAIKAATTAAPGSKWDVLYQDGILVILRRPHNGL